MDLGSPGEVEEEEGLGGATLIPVAVLMRVLTSLVAGLEEEEEEAGDQ